MAADTARKDAERDAETATLEAEARIAAREAAAADKLGAIDSSGRGGGNSGVGNGNGNGKEPEEEAGRESDAGRAWQILLATS